MQENAERCENPLGEVGEIWGTAFAPCSRENEMSDYTKDSMYILRLPDGMRDQIEAAAGKNSRSTNAEFIDRLQKSFEAIENKGLTTKGESAA